MESGTQGSPGRQSDRRPYTRTDHRSRSHDVAHGEEAADQERFPVLAHPLVPKGNASFISDEAELSRLIGRLRGVGSFAYDSEFIGELTYFPKLCLIQVASRDEVALIDPLEGLSLTPFWELLCDPAVEKIVHAGQQDIEPVVRNFGRAPANVFDTQISAGFAAMPYPVSLSKLVWELTGRGWGRG